MEVQEKKDCYVNSVTSIAKKQEQGECSSCCCIPLCTSTFYDKNKCKSGIELSTFPAETSLRRKWLAAISRYRRKGGVDQFKITNATRVCEFHFKPDEIRMSKGIGRKTLLRGSVLLSLNLNNQGRRMFENYHPSAHLRPQKKKIAFMGKVVS